MYESQARYETSDPRAVWNAGADARAAFIQKTYLHLFVAILAFTGLEIVLFQSGLALRITQAVAGVNWLLILGGFMVVGWIAQNVALQSVSLPAQYLALAAYVVAEALIFVPLLYVANSVAPGTIESAAVATLAGFTGLTAIAFFTRKDFSFLRSVLMWGGVCALVLIVLAVLFGFNLGILFSIAMVALAGGMILYDTSNILHHYPQDRYVAGALALFASVALLFWYVLRIFMASRD